MIEHLSDLKQLLSSPKDIVITAHRNPDGDAIGSSLGLAYYLQQEGHLVKVVFPSELPSVFNWMPGVDQVIVYDLEQEKAIQAVEEADMFFCLDFNALDRIDRIGEAMVARKKPVVMIDHHIDPEPFADFMLSDVAASSTSELVFDFLQMLGEDQKIDKTLGECLYTGIVTDTGSFKFSTSPKLFRTVALLIEKGVDDYSLQDRIFNCLPEKNLRLLGHCLANRMEILPEYKTGIIVLTKRDYINFDIQRGDTEGIVNYLLKIKAVKIAAFITEQPRIVKISLRSKGDFSVQEIAYRYFNGGGHRNAAGGYAHASLRSTVARFKEILPQYKQQLIDSFS